MATYLSSVRRWAGIRLVPGEDSEVPRDLVDWYILFLRHASHPCWQEGGDTNG